MFVPGTPLFAPSPPAPVTINIPADQETVLRFRIPANTFAASYISNDATASPSPDSPSPAPLPNHQQNSFVPPPETVVPPLRSVPLVPAIPGLAIDELQKCNSGVFPFQGEYVEAFRPPSPVSLVDLPSDSHGGPYFVRPINWNVPGSDAGPLMMPVISEAAAITLRRKIKTFFHEYFHVMGSFPMAVERPVGDYHSMARKKLYQECMLAVETMIAAAGEVPHCEFTK